MINWFNHMYPYTNFHELNLDWVIATVRHGEHEIANFIGVNTIKYADPILWNIESQYEANTVVVDSQTGNAYISTKPVPRGVHLSRTDYWTQIYNYANVVDTLREQIAHNEGESTTATLNYVKGDLLFSNGLLYRVIAENGIIPGDSFVVNSNVAKTTIEEELDRLKDVDAQLQDNIDAEATAREDADDVLQGNIDAEATARENADDVLQGNIDAEATARENADDALRNDINSVVDRNIQVRGQILSMFHNRSNAHAEFYLSDDLNRYAPIKWNIEVEDQPNEDTDVLVARDGSLLYHDGVLYIACTWSDLSTYGIVIHSSEDLVHWKSHKVSLGALDSIGVIAPTLIEVGDDVYVYGATNQGGDYNNCQLFYAKLTTISHNSIVAATPTSFTCSVDSEEKSLFDPCLFNYDNKLYLAANDKANSYLFVNSGNLGQFSYVKTLTPYAEATCLVPNSNGSVIGTVQRFHNEAINIYKNYPIDTIAFNIEDEDVRGSTTQRKECEFIESGRFQSAEHGGHIYITHELARKIDALNINSVVASMASGYQEFINLGDFGTYESSEGGIVHVGAIKIVPRTIYAAQSNNSNNDPIAYYHFEMDKILDPFDLGEFYVVFEIASPVTVRVTSPNFNAEFNVPTLTKQRGRMIHFVKSPVYGWTLDCASISDLGLVNAKGYVYGNVCQVSATFESATAGDTLLTGLPAPWKQEYIYPTLVSDDGSTIVPCYLDSTGTLKTRTTFSTICRLTFSYICV